MWNNTLKQAVTLPFTFSSALYYLQIISHLALHRQVLRVSHERSNVGSPWLAAVPDIKKQSFCEWCPELRKVCPVIVWCSLFQLQYTIPSQV
jgi:hypothetical protein